MLLPDGSTASGPQWLAGVYSLCTVAKLFPVDPAHVFNAADDNTALPTELQLITSNEVVLPVAPELRSNAMITAHAGDTIQLTLGHNVRTDQRVRLLLDDREWPVLLQNPVVPAYVNTVNVNLTGLDVGTYRLRLRVNGVDSIPVKINPPGVSPVLPVPLQVDANQTLEITP